MTAENVTKEERDVFGGQSMVGYLRSPGSSSTQNWRLNIVADYIDGEDEENLRLIGLLKQYGGHWDTDEHRCDVFKDDGQCTCGWFEVESEGWGE